MRFLHPLVLLLLPLAALFAGLALAADVRRRRALRLFANDSVLRRSGVALPESGQLLARICIASVAAGLALLIVAAARPQWGKSDVSVKSRGGSLLVALDVSRSMLARDVRPNRLERAKTDILDLVAELNGDRAGLLVFRGKGVMLCPLTTDYAFLRQAIDGISIDSAPRGETDIADALDKAMAALDAAGEENCAIILISDGEDLAGRAKASAEQAAKKNIPVFTVGLGDKSGATIETEDGVLKFGGRAVQTKLSEGTLREIAAITGGAYIPLETSGTASTTLGAIYRQHLSKIARREFEEMLENRFVERYQLFLVPGILLLILPALFSRGRLGPSRRRRGPGAAREADGAGKAALSVLFAVAFALPEALAQESGRDRRALFNGAVDLYSAGDYTNSSSAMQPFSLRRDMPEAVELFAASEFKIAESEEAGTNVEERIARLGAAAAAYQRLLALDGADGARLSRNLARATAQLPGLVEKRRVAEIQGKYGKIPPAALLAAMAEAQRKISAALDSVPGPAAARIAAFEDLALAEADISDMDECFSEAARESIESITNESQKAALTELFRQRSESVASALASLEDVDAGAARDHSADAEIRVFDSWKLFAEPPQFIDEAILATTNVFQNAGTPRWRRRPDNVVAYDVATAFSQTFPKWAEDYLAQQAQRQQQEGSTNAPSFTEESVEEIMRLTESLLFILKDGCEFDKDEESRKNSASEALPILLKIRELLPHDDQNQSGGQQGQGQSDSNEDKKDGGDRDQKNDADENQQDKPSEKPQKDSGEQDKPLPEDVRETLRKAIQREREHEAEKQKLRRAIPLPPSARDW